MRGQWGPLPTWHAAWLHATSAESKFLWSGQSIAIQPDCHTLELTFLANVKKSLARTRQQVAKRINFWMWSCAIDVNMVEFAYIHYFLRCLLACTLTLVYMCLILSWCVTLEKATHQNATWTWKLCNLPSIGQPARKCYIKYIRICHFLAMSGYINANNVCQIRKEQNLHLFTARNTQPGVLKTKMIYISPGPMAFSFDSVFWNLGFGFQN